MGTTMTVTSKINYQYLKNKTKDEIIFLLLHILDTRCEADAKIEKQQAEIEQLKAQAQADEYALSETLNSVCPTCAEYSNEIKRQAAEIERMKVALENIEQAFPDMDQYAMNKKWVKCDFLHMLQSIARAALNEGGTP